jgi:thymidylate synthase ThyX
VTDRPQLETGPPLVTLRAATARPYDGAIAAARTCYAPHVVGVDEVTEAQRSTIGPLTFAAGHHTVYQHAHFEFGLENISRHCVWSFLHAHPFYNSEQSSQRYVRLDEIRAFVPQGLDAAARAVYETALVEAWSTYRELSDVLKEDALRLLGELRRLTARTPPKLRRRVEREAEKKAIEAARYVIPVAAYTALVHTVPAIVLHRLRRMARSGDASAESALVIDAMVQQVRALDADLFERIGREASHHDDGLESAFPRPSPDGEGCVARLEAQLDGRASRLVGYVSNAESLVADAVRAVLGLSSAQLSDDEALARALDPSLNRHRLDTLQLAVHSPLSRTLHHASYTFLKRLSLTADSQDQRHRLVPGSRPLLAYVDTRKPDFVTPALIAANPRAVELYQRAMDRAWKAKDRLLDGGVPLESALYLLPNARAIRFHETGNLLFLAQKWVQRTCLNAQEEIFQASMDELDQVREVHPRLAAFLGPPCVLRVGRTAPICTEGQHFCGVPVWRTFPHVERRI